MPIYREIDIKNNIENNPGRHPLIHDLIEIIDQYNTALGEGINLGKEYPEGACIIEHPISGISIFLYFHKNYPLFQEILDSINKAAQIPDPNLPICNLDHFNGIEEYPDRARNLIEYTLSNGNAVVWNTGTKLAVPVTDSQTTGPDLTIAAGLMYRLGYNFTAQVLEILAGDRTGHDIKMLIGTTTPYNITLTNSSTIDTCLAERRNQSN